MQPLLIFRHIEYEGPGYFQDFLVKNNIPFRLICIDLNEPVPGNIDNVSGLVFMGGHMSVNDELPWMPAEISLIQQAIEKKLPVLGHCLGGQLIAKAMGAKITQNYVAEIGWHTTSRYDNIDSSIWLQDLDEDLELFHWHFESFELPSGASPLLKNSFCEYQGFVKDNTLALQCHIEMTESMVKVWVEKNRDKLIESKSMQAADYMLQDLSSRIVKLNSIAEKIYSHWVKGLQK
ncbi:MAG: type 1 glutamine amidotransferase [Gammaproteobacteria bacterium]|jgi:GMP synthase-like glutamine amidotransferase